MTAIVLPSPWLVAADLIDPPPFEPSELEADWRAWIETVLADYAVFGFAPHHEQLWDWVWAIRPGVRPDPFVGVWPRGGAKSTSAEMACVALGARRARRYGLYVCDTQDQADDHVGNVAGMLESEQLELRYPDLSDRAVGKFGASKGWRRNRLRTKSGFTVDAIGLDTAARGVKLEDARPDFLVVDDVDGELDTAAVVARKVKTLTRRLMPAGSSDLAVLAIQNLVHPDSIFAQLVDGRADFLARRIVSGPIPAVEGLATERQADGRTRIIAGQPTWMGQNLAACESFIDEWGLSAFLAECQHDVEPPAGGMFDHLDFAHCTWEQLPELVRCCVWVDPAVTDTDQSDSMGIQADGLGVDGKVYRLWSWEARTSPLDALTRAITKAVDLGADVVGVETDQGGDTWQSVYREAAGEVLAAQPGVRVPPFRWEKAGAGHGPKTHRASLMLADYERARIVHVAGTHEVLERALRRFPKSKPYDLVDAAFWSWRDLRARKPARSHGRQVLAAGGIPAIGSRR